MTVRVGIIMDPIAQIAFKKDSSLAMLLAAQARGWTLFYMEQRDLYQLGNQARARMCPLRVFNDPQHWFEKDGEVDAALTDLDVILMLDRKSVVVGRSGSVGVAIVGARSTTT